MSRTFVMLAALVLGACDDKPKAAPSRSDMAQASDTVHTVETSKPADHAAPAAPRPPRALCTNLPAAAGKPFPKVSLDRITAPGAAELPDKPATSGRWTWVNLWAGWCNPCKEEVPRLRKWNAEFAGTASAFDLAFVSLDDDPRQARKFVEEQPATGLRASYLAREGANRNAFVAALGVKPEPSLPVHALFDPAGKLRCIIEGAVEDSDRAFFAAQFQKP